MVSQLHNSVLSDALIINVFLFVDSCGGTYSGGVDDPPPVLFIEYAPIIIHWKKVPKIINNIVTGLLLCVTLPNVVKI